VNCHIANERDVITVSLAHGSTTGDPLQGAQIANKFLVYGENSYKQLIEKGVSDRKLEIVGAPYLDSGIKQTGRINSEIKRKLLKDKEQMILIATSGPGHTISYNHHVKTIKSIMKVTTRYPEIKFVAKLHRKDRIEYYEKIKKEIPESKLIVVPNNTSKYPNNIFTWLQGCKLLMTGASSCAVEAMVMKVPVITMDFMNELLNVDFIDAGATIHIRSYSELKVVVKNLIDSNWDMTDIINKADSFIKKNYYRTNGKASYRSAKIIENLIKS
jgi:UDP-N-acetylglucosamine 2-epimerase